MIATGACAIVVAPMPTILLRASDGHELSGHRVDPIGPARGGLASFEPTPAAHALQRTLAFMAD